MSLNQVTIEGNLTGDPQVKFGENGKSRCIFSVAVNKGQGDDERVTFVDATAFGKLGENIAESLKRGDAVVLHGELNSYTTEVETADGIKKIGRLSMTAWGGGPSLRWATAAVTKNPRQGSGNAGHADPAGQAQAPASSAAPATGSDDSF